MWNNRRIKQLEQEVESLKKALHRVERCVTLGSDHGRLYARDWGVAYMGENDDIRVNEIVGLLCGHLGYGYVKTRPEVNLVKLKDKFNE